MVVARGANDDDWRTGMSGADGAFLITGVLPGSYTLEVLFAVSATGGGGTDSPPPVRSDWTFELTGLYGELMLAGGAIGDWDIKTISVGGSDFTDSPIDFSMGDVDGIEVLLSNRHSEVSGGVTDGRGAIAGDASVVIFPADPDRWTRVTRKIASARPDRQGRFSLKGLRAGRYLAIALDYLEEGEEHDPDLLKDGHGSRRASRLAMVNHEHSI